MAELSRHFKSRSDLVLESSLLRFFFFFFHTHSWTYPFSNFWHACQGSWKPYLVIAGEPSVSQQHCPYSNPIASKSLLTPSSGKLLQWHRVSKQSGFAKWRSSADRPLCLSLPHLLLFVSLLRFPASATRGRKKAHVDSSFFLHVSSSKLEIEGFLLCVPSSDSLRS